MEEITRQEWGDWKQQKVTREFLKRLQEKRELLKEGLAEGQATGSVEQERVIGQCQAYKDTINYGLYDFETLDQEESEQHGS